METGPTRMPASSNTSRLTASSAPPRQAPALRRCLTVPLSRNRPALVARCSARARNAVARGRRTWRGPAARSDRAKGLLCAGGDGDCGDLGASALAWATTDHKRLRYEVNDLEVRALAGCARSRKGCSTQRHSSRSMLGQLRNGERHQRGCKISHAPVTWRFRSGAMPLAPQY